MCAGLALGADASTELTGSRSLADAGGQVVNGQECPIDNADRRLQVGCRYGSGAIITNGLIKLGVNCGGELNFDGVGLGYVIQSGTNAGTEAEATAGYAEGWGARATVAGGSTYYGWANQAYGCTIGSYVSFTTTSTPGSEPDTAISVVTLPGGLPGGSLEVTHHYHPSTETDNAYEVDVTLRNLDITASLTNVQYRRSMDWDIWPEVRNTESTVHPCNAFFQEHSSDQLSYFCSFFYLLNYIHTAGSQMRYHRTGSFAFEYRGY